MRSRPRLSHSRRGAGGTVDFLRDYGHSRLVSTEEKETFAAAANPIPDECSIMVNIGTTTEQVARALFGRTNLVVVTNNVNIINTLTGFRAKELILAGGTVRPSDGAIVGEATVEFISRFKADYAVIGASSIDGDGAVLGCDAREVSVARAILRNARAGILVANAVRFDRTASVRVCDISDVDCFVTDRRPPAAFQRAAETGETRNVMAGGDRGGMRDAV